MHVQTKREEQGQKLKEKKKSRGLLYHKMTGVMISKAF